MEPARRVRRPATGGVEQGGWLGVKRVSYVREFDPRFSTDVRTPRDSPEHPSDSPNADSPTPAHADSPGAGDGPPEPQSCPSGPPSVKRRRAPPFPAPPRAASPDADTRVSASGTRAREDGARRRVLAAASPPSSCRKRSATDRDDALVLPDDDDAGRDARPRGGAPPPPAGVARERPPDAPAAPLLPVGAASFCAPASRAGASALERASDRALASPTRRRARRRREAVTRPPYTPENRRTASFPGRRRRSSGATRGRRSMARILLPVRCGTSAARRTASGRASSSPRRVARFGPGTRRGRETSATTPRSSARTGRATCTTTSSTLPPRTRTWTACERRTR